MGVCRIRLDSSIEGCRLGPIRKHHRVCEVVDRRGYFRFKISCESFLKSHDHVRSGPVINPDRMQVI
jgi:hypothetical protein